MAVNNKLIEMSFKEAQSRAGLNIPSNKAILESQQKISRQYLQLATGAFKAYKDREEKIELGKDEQLATFKGTLQKNYQKIYEQKETMPQKVIAAIDAEVRRLQGEFEAVNTYGENDNVENERARMRINAELQKIINEAINARKTFIDLRNRSTDWPDDAIKYKNINALNKMMDLDALDKDDDVAVFFQDGKLTFSARNYNTRRVFNPDSEYIKFKTEKYGDPLT